MYQDDALVFREGHHTYLILKGVKSGDTFELTTQHAGSFRTLKLRVAQDLPAPDGCPKTPRGVIRVRKTFLDGGYDDSEVRWRDPTKENAAYIWAEWTPPRTTGVGLHARSAKVQKEGLVYVLILYHFDGEVFRGTVCYSEPGQDHETFWKEVYDLATIL